MTNFDPNMKKKIFLPKIEAGHVLIMFLFFGGFQPGCSYKRCSYKKKKVYGVDVCMTSLVFRTTKRIFTLIPYGNFKSEKFRSLNRPNFEKLTI